MRMFRKLSESTQEDPTPDGGLAPRAGLLEEERQDTLSMTKGAPHQ